MADRFRDDPDAALVERCLKDDADAWRQLVTAHRPALIDLARRIVPSGQAVDVVDAVIADLWQRRKLARYGGRSSVRTWLGAVVLNAALNARRAAQARPEAAADSPGAEPIVDPPPDTQDLSAILTEAIAALSSPVKTLVLMYYEQDLSLDEMSAVIGSSKSTLSRTLRQARVDILAAAERLAAARGTTLESLRRGVDLSQLDLDLREACRGKRDRRPPPVSNQ